MRPPMPDSHEILEHLAAASLDARWLALAWHSIVGAALVAWAAGWRPAPSQVVRALSVPLLSASAIAWMFGNPFNGTVMLAAALILAAPRARTLESEATPSGPWARMIGLGLLGFSWVYPHFFEEPPALDYLLFSPMGVIPCPTLALVLGLLLLLEGIVGHWGTIIVAAAGAFYGLFGWLVLGVNLDIVLAAGSGAVLARSIFLRAARQDRYLRGATRSSSDFKRSSS